MAKFDFMVPEYGYVLLTVIYFNLTVLYMMSKVVNYRKAHNIFYPVLYSKTDNIFNCYQRAHLNTLEFAPLLFSLYIPSALAYPCLASSLAAVYITSRFPYAWGYYTGDPKKRQWGVWGEIGLVGLLLLLVYVTICQFGILS